MLRCDLQHQIQLRLRRRQHERLQFYPMQSEAVLCGVLHDELDLEEGGAGQVTLGGQFFHQTLEGQVLMFIGSQRRLPHASQKLTEGLLSLQLRPQHQLVDEKSDQPFGLPPVAVRDVGPHHDIALSRITTQQQLEARQQHYEQRRVLAPRQLPQLPAQLLVQLESDARSPIAPLRGTPKVRQQLQLRSPGQLLPPVLQLPLQNLALQPLPLPHRVIPILNRQRLQPNIGPTNIAFIQRTQLSTEHIQRPGVPDKVMHCQQKHIALTVATLENLRA